MNAVVSLQSGLYTLEYTYKDSIHTTCPGHILWSACSYTQMVLPDNTKVYSILIVITCTGLTSTRLISGISNSSDTVKTRTIPIPSGTLLKADTQ